MAGQRKRRGVRNRTQTEDLEPDPKSKPHHSSEENERGKEQGCAEQREDERRNQNSSQYEDMEVPGNHEGQFKRSSKAKNGPSSPI